MVMKQRQVRHKLTNTIFVLLLLALVIANLAGCTSTNGPSAGLQIIPLSNREVIDLNSQDVVRIMRRAGFSDEQILKLGTELRNGLAQSGAVQLRTGNENKIEATFAVHDRYVYISTRIRGSFIYDARKQVGRGSNSPQS